MRVNKKQNKPMDKRYQNAQAEAELQQLWQEKQVYKKENNPGKTYSIDTPPPTVSGSLHIGHIFSYTQTDIIARYKRMNGYSVFYPFGFDDNGLPTERFVEKKLKTSAHSMPRSEFIKLCLVETKKAAAEFTRLWQRMGLSVDWDACYSTISDSTRKISQESFIRLYNKGFVYRKNEPALYCTACRTSVAQAELDDIEKPSTFNDIVFTLEDGSQVTIGTTRPELLPSCVALFYHPDDSRYQHLNGKKATTPLFDRTVPILPDETVTQEKGTGLVMCCTFGDKHDVEWFKKHNLPYVPSVDRGGRWTENTGFLKGLKAADARKLVLEKLQEAGLLVAQKPITHAVNVHERCKKEIEFIALPQWFLNILDHKQALLDEAEKVTWKPEFMKARYKNWVQNISWDWGLSRQRFYGIAFPAWHCEDCNKILLADSADLPIDPQEQSYPAGKCTQCGSSALRPDTDVMDTWNTSSLTPYLCHNLFYGVDTSPFETETINEFLPMSMRAQAHDIIRTWAFYTMTKTWMHNGTIPWTDTVISGHVLADGKEKLSKSKNNAKMTPERLLDTYSADVIRYWTASGSLGHDIAFSEQQLKIGQRLVTKLWNAFRFTSEHLTTKVERPQNLGALNEWLLHKSAQTSKQYHNALEGYEFHHALVAAEAFFWNDFCDNYIELVKNQLFNPDQYSPEEVAATRWTLQTVGVYILQLFAPFVPFITDKLFQILFKDQYDVASLHQLRFIDEQHSWNFEESALSTELAIRVITHIRKLKTEQQLSLKVELASLTLVGTQIDLDTLANFEQLIKGVAQAQEINYTTTQDTKSELHQDNQAWHMTVATTEQEA